MTARANYVTDRGQYVTARGESRISFAILGRHRLVLSPEEEFAMTLGEHGRLGEEGYGHTHVSEVGESAHAAGPVEPTPTTTAGGDAD